ncbi:T9SS type A sorting domain-containing protein [Chryseobacterium cheonjiense]|uniref:T9SS type A sorting domain-containing protein n=1 Tax=Chryseobacterium cheonjiense TaxID=2728845 RepID=A0A7Y0FJN3_9FLAO|nr:T9SS type A sorting domain-containing protein [Chryseobacterium cheonjiense]NML58465.1 T9SS type A sorting domain-containing protein [Chryseobacterium cheonjiense]
MKKTLLIASLILGIIGNAQTILSETFEGSTFPPTGWTRSNTNATRAWDFTNVNFTSGSTLETTFKITGTKSACVDWISSTNTAILASPTFSLATASNPVLKFNVKVGWSYMINQNAGNLTAQVSTNGTTWTNIWTEDTEPGFIDDGDSNADTDLYNTVLVQKSLATYIGQSNVQIRFRYTGADADAVSIDDVQVLGSVLATDEVTARPKANIYPNPTKGEFTIQGDKKIKSSTIYDVLGKQIIKFNTEKVDISNLPKGTYFVAIDFIDGTSVAKKVIKE